MDKKRMIIGVVTARVSDTEQKRIISGIIEEAQKSNIDVAVISNIYNPNNEDFELSFENNIYDLINSEELDAIILISEVIINTGLQKLIKEKLASKSVPVITIGSSTEGFIIPGSEKIDTDNSMDICDITDHLIEDHHFTDIDILTGLPEIPASSERIEGYKMSLESHGIPYNEKKVHYGDFWFTSGAALAKKYISGALPLPQAIVCTNDYMAFGLLDELSKSSINVPEDVTVTGYEYVNMRNYHYPILTTYERNRKQLGKDAVRKIRSILRDVPYTPGPLKGRLIRGNSCTCGINRQEYCRELEEEREKDFYSDLNLFSQYERMLTECKSMNDYTQILQSHSYLLKGICGLYLCLFENWSELFSGTSEASETMTGYTILNYHTPDMNSIFMNKYSLSSIFSRFSIPQVYYFNPVFVSRKYLGYAILVYQNAYSFDPLVRNWLKSASNALEFLHMKNDISYLTQCQNLSNYHDSVTGLYNREGFSDAVNSSLSGTEDSSEFIMIMLKTELFTDSFQFDKQDRKYRIAQETAEAMKLLIVNKNEFCGRINESTYIFAGFNNYSDNYHEHLADRLNTIMLHMPAYVREYGMNSFEYTVRTMSASGFSLEKTIHDMTDELSGKIKLTKMMLSLPHFSEFRKARDRIYLNPSESASSEETCLQLCISVGYFRNVYKKYFGISYHQDCIKGRISLAKYLLITTSMSITAVASKCGYEDEKYFMRLFQQNTSFTPNRYRMIFQPL